MRYERRLGLEILAALDSDRLGAGAPDEGCSVLVFRLKEIRCECSSRLLDQEASLYLKRGRKRCHVWHSRITSFGPPQGWQSGPTSTQSHNTPGSGIPWIGLSRCSANTGMRVARP